MIVTPDLENYMQQLLPIDHPLLEEMEQYAQENRVPIIERSSIQLIRTLLLYKKDVKRILEIGTAIGYSTIWLAEAAQEAHIDTIERDSRWAIQAQSFIERAQLYERVTIHLADATAFAPELKRKYDIIFIDAAKGQYQLFFEEYSTYLQPDGLIISDNVFFHGHVFKDHVKNKRIQSLVNKIKRFNEWLKDHPDFETSFVPIGDGLALSCRRPK